MLDALEQPFAIALALNIGVDRQTGELAHGLIGERIECGTAEDHAIVFDHGEVGDFAFDQAAVALDQRAVFLERSDQSDDAADIVLPGFS